MVKLSQGIFPLAFFIKEICKNVCRYKNKVYLWKNLTNEGK